MSIPPCPTSFRLMPESDRMRSLQQTMAAWQRHEDLWVFAYGSLIWRPDFSFQERRDAWLHGYHRSLCLWSRINRGTPERPGLVFALDHGGSCRGVAFRIAAARVPDTMEALWHREMPSGSYIPKWLTCRTPLGTVRALAFTMNRHADAYVRDLATEQQIQVIRAAQGRNGPCLEYVLETARALKNFNINDRRLDSLLHHLQSALVSVAA